MCFLAFTYQTDKCFSSSYSFLERQMSYLLAFAVECNHEKKKRFHLKPSALTTICHKPICNFLGLFQLCALNIQDITGWITLHPRRITGKQDFFFPVKFLMSGTFSSFSTWWLISISSFLATWKKSRWSWREMSSHWTRDGNTWWKPILCEISFTKQHWKMIHSRLN